MKTGKTNIKKLGSIIIAAIALFATISVNAQSTLKKFSYELTLNGTSNIHDWTMKSSGSNLDGYFNLNASTKQLEGIQPITLNMPVKGLKSTESLLNSRAYDALKADKFPNFTFKLTSAKASGNQINLVGDLTISGTTKEITLPATIQKNNDGTTVLTGTKKFKMTDFNVAPPKYMLGMMKVYDDLSINYTVRF